jgi:hypothetical protein
MFQIKVVEKNETHFMFSTISLCLTAFGMTKQIGCCAFILEFLYLTITMVSWSHSILELFMLFYLCLFSPSLAQIIEVYSVQMER